jgi:hypothetical protein
MPFELGSAMKYTLLALAFSMPIGMAMLIGYLIGSGIGF